MKESSNKPRLAYTLDELADALGVSRAFLYRLRGEGKLKMVKLGRRTLVTAEEARRMLADLQEAA